MVDWIYDNEALVAVFESIDGGTRVGQGITHRSKGARAPTLSGDDVGRIALQCRFRLL